MPWLPKSSIWLLVLAESILAMIAGILVDCVGGGFDFFDTMSIMMRVATDSETTRDRKS